MNMGEQPDLRFDIDALFDHMVANLAHDMADEKDWTFLFRSPELSKLQQLAVDLGTEFIIQLQEEVEEYRDGVVTAGPPLLSVIRRGALTAAEVKSIAAHMSETAAKHGVDYEGVQAFRVIDEDVLFGWLDVDEAVWRLRHFTDNGLPDDADMPWTFRVQAVEIERLDKTAEEFVSIGYDRVHVYEEPDDGGNYTLCLFMNGTNNESALTEMYSKLGEIAQQHRAEPAGIQFFEEEELAE
jgi:hypothetical protein